MVLSQEKEAPGFPNLLLLFIVDLRAGNFENHEDMKRIHRKRKYAVEISALSADFITIESNMQLI